MVGHFLNDCQVGQHQPKTADLQCHFLPDTFSVTRRVQWVNARCLISKKKEEKKKKKFDHFTKLGRNPKSDKGLSWCDAENVNNNISTVQLCSKPSNLIQSDASCHASDFPKPTCTTEFLSSDSEAIIQAASFFEFGTATSEIQNPIEDSKSTLHWGRRRPWHFTKHMLLEFSVFTKSTISISKNTYPLSSGWADFSNLFLFFILFLQGNIPIHSR